LLLAWATKPKLQPPSLLFLTLKYGRRRRKKNNKLLWNSKEWFEICAIFGRDGEEEMVGANKSVHWFLGGKG
jgi:hypothetical protein